MYTANKIRTSHPAFRQGHRRSRMIVIFCLLITALFCLTAAGNTASAATYYLDAVNGNDSNAGTSASPWKTVSKAFSYFDGLGDNGSGDTLLVRDGNYTDHGSTEERTDWLRIEAEAGQTNVKFDWFAIGATGITPYKNSYLYFKDITIEIDPDNNNSNQLVSIIRSRYVTFENVTFIGMAYPGEGDTDYYDWLQGQNYGINILRGCKYITIDGCTFTGISKAIYTRDKEGSGDSTDRVESVTVTDCNIMRCDTAVHAWGHDFTISNNHVHNMYGDGFKVLCENIGINDNHIEGIWNYVYFVDETEATYNNDTKVITASSGTPYTFPEYGITSARITVDGNLSAFKEIASWTTSTITMNTAFGASFTGTVTKVEINDGGHSDAIQIMWDSSADHVVTKNAVIARNHIHDHIHQGIYSNTVGAPTDGLLVENNLIYDCGAHELQIFDSIGVVIRNNTVDGVVVLRDGTVATEVSNNIFYNFTDYSTHHVSPEQVSIDYFDNNILYQYWFGGLPGSNNIEFNNVSLFQALFTNYNDHDYSFSSNSMAVDFCPLDKAPATDLEGKTRIDIQGVGNDDTDYADAGCYEYVPSDPNNQAPVLQDIGDKSVNENETLTIDVNATDPNGDTITYSIQNKPSGATLDPQTGDFAWTPSYSQAESYDVTFIASDGQAQDSETITITVNNVNRPPVAADDSATVAEDSRANAIDVLANDSDADGDTLTITAVTQPSHGSVVITGGGTGLTYTPAANYNGSDSFTYTVSDGNGGTNTATVNMTITSVPDAPVLDAIGDKSVNENSQLTFTASASDTDVPGNTLTFSLINAPVGASIDPVTGYFTWIPTEVQGPGSYDVTVRVTDNGVGSLYDQEAIKITVNEINVAPVLGPIDDQTIDVGSQLTFTANATDADVPANGLTFSLSNAPAGASIDPVSGYFTWIPTEAQGPDSYDVTVRVTDDGAGNLYDEESMTITIVPDETDPTVTNLSPAADSIQAPLNTLVILDITDSGDGVDANSVTINVNDNIVYSGNTARPGSTTYGECHRIGTKAHYAFIYQSNEMFEFDQPINVTAKATDLAGNIMDEYSYSFKTEMRSFGENKKVDLSNLKKGRPVTVRDSNGDIWAAWHAGAIADSRDIYIGRLLAEEEYFGDINKIRGSTADQCNPVIAIGTDDKLYVAWQDNREGDWDIYVSTSVDGTNWSTETRVNDPNNDNQANPAIVVDSNLPNNNAYIVWEDDRNGNQDIYIAASSDGFATKTVSQQITSDSSDQVEPAIAADSGNTIYVVWTDTRIRGKKDIYGAASNNGPWTNIPVVTEEDGQSSPAIATEADGSILHLVWVDDRIVDANDDIFYAKTTGGLSPLTGRSIIDDPCEKDQISPVIITTGSTGDDLRVFACWRDERNADADLYAVEIDAGAGTNVFVGDDGTNSDQSEPAIGIDKDGHPYLVWTNERTDICYAGSTFIESELASTNVSISSTATVGTMWNAIQSVDDASAELPQGAYLCDVKVTISKIKNPQKLNFERFTGVYEFGPSGMEFTQPVTITIPYEVNGSENVSYKAYWYNSLTNTLSQQGITDVQTIVTPSGLHALRFKTTHFSPFILGGALGGLLGGGGGGGCSMSPDSQDSIAELLLPYIGLAVAMVILKLRDRRKRKALNITKSEC